MSLSPFFSLALLGIFITRGIILACVLPPFAGWDEYQHVGYVDYCAHSTGPAVYGETQLDAGYARAIAEFPQPHDALSEPFGGQTYQDYWSHAPRPAPAASPIGFYQSQHPFLYYRLMSPVYQLCGGRGNLRLAVSILRLINLAFGTIALAMVLLWIRRSLPPALGLIAASCVIFNPILLLNVVRVSNDALAFALGTGVVVLCLGTLDRPRQVISVALLLPMAILAKATNLTLLPLVAIAFVSQKNDRRNVIAGIVTVTVFAACTFSYFSFNLHHFGELTPMQEAIANHNAGRTFLEMLRKPPLALWLVWAWCLWVRNALWVGGWSFLQVPRAIIGTYEVVMAVGAVSLVIALMRGKIAIRGRALRMIIALLLCAHAGLMYHALESYSAWAGHASTNPWYAAVAIPWWMILICCGLFALPRVGVWLAMSIPLIDITAEAYGMGLKMLPFYYQGESLRQTLARQSSLHPAGMGQVTLLVCLLMLLFLLLSVTRLGWVLSCNNRIASQSGGEIS